jgi:hypothetical protein
MRIRNIILIVRKLALPQENRYNETTCKQRSIRMTVVSNEEVTNTEEATGSQ